MHHDPTFWLLARAAGLTAYALLALSVLVGLVLKSRPFARLRPAVATELHKTLALTGLGAVVMHAVALVLDSTVKVSLAALVVPGLVSYRPPAVAAGVVAGWLFILVTGSFWLRKRIGTRVWRRLHWATYALFWSPPCTASLPAPTRPGRGVRPGRHGPRRRSKTTSRAHNRAITGAPSSLPYPDTALETVAGPMVFGAHTQRLAWPAVGRSRPPTEACA